MKKSKSGFTIVEIFIVLSIMAVLSSLLITGAMFARQKQKNAKTYVLLDSIAAALEMYKSDFGEYPPDDSSLHFYLGGRFHKGVSPVNSTINAGPYIVYDTHDLGAPTGPLKDIDADGGGETIYEVIDGWGNAIHYESDDLNRNNLNSYDLWSNGSNGVDENGAGDDINNWD